MEPKPRGNGPTQTSPGCKERKATQLELFFKQGCFKGKEVEQSAQGLYAPRIKRAAKEAGVDEEMVTPLLKRMKTLKKLGINPTEEVDSSPKQEQLQDTMDQTPPKPEQAKPLECTYDFKHKWAELHYKGTIYRSQKFQQKDPTKGNASRAIALFEEVGEAQILGVWWGLINPPKDEIKAKEKPIVPQRPLKTKKVAERKHQRH